MTEQHKKASHNWQGSEDAVLWERDVPLRRSEAGRPQIHPNAALERQVLGSRSFSELLQPRFDLPAGYIGLRDMHSTGAFFEMSPVPSEARPAEALHAQHEKLCHALTSVFPERAEGEWVVQIFLHDEPLTANALPKIRQFAARHGTDDEYTGQWLQTLAEHLGDTEKGIFSDSPDSKWQARERRIRLCVWRRSRPGEPPDPTDNIEHVSRKLTDTLLQAGVRLRQLAAGDLYDWLRRWFAPGCEHPSQWIPELASADIGRSALDGAAPTSTDDGLWWFSGRPGRFITIDEPRQVPEIGHLAGERAFGDVAATMWDRMPPDSIWSMTIIFSEQDAVTDHIKRVRHNSVGADPQVLARRQLADDTLTVAAAGQPIFRMFCGVFVFAPDRPELDQRTNQSLALLSSQGLTPIAPQNDPIAHDSYIRALPFGFDPVQDRRWFARRARLWHSEHIVRMAPFFGRSVGTGRPGIVHFNRGGELLAYDPLHQADRQKNAHALILGPTGSGKTSLLIYKLLHLLAVHRPRLYLITSLPTFGLFADYCESDGLTVARRSITADGAVTLPPFTAAPRISGNNDVPSDDDDDAGRDLLGEMEILARLMITGGQQKEEDRLTRADRALLRSAIAEAGRRTPADSETMVSDVISALRDAASGHWKDKDQAGVRTDAAAQMAGALQLFTTGVEGKIFDRPGEAWPDADVTVVELGLYARKGYEDRLAVALTGLMTAIQNRVESAQTTTRQTIVVIDEAHVMLQNPLISPYLARIVATWRTFGAWLWIATQNLRQFPESAQELLDQPEWWILLAIDKDEVDQISLFRALTDEQREMILSARKQPGRYTEGVVLSGRLLNLFRNVPPAIALALAQTEKHEKAQRQRLCEKHGMSDLEAARHIAAEIRAQRLAT